MDMCTYTTTHSEIYVPHIYAHNILQIRNKVLSIRLPLAYSNQYTIYDIALLTNNLN